MLGIASRGVLAIGQDMLHRIGMISCKSKKEEQYRSVFEATYDGLVIFDLDGYIVEVNPAYCSTFGYTYEELIGMHAGVLIAPETLPALADALKVLKAGDDTQTVMAQALRKDGTTFYTESQGTTLTYRGKPPCARSRP